MWSSQRYRLSVSNEETARATHVHSAVLDAVVSILFIATPLSNYFPDVWFCNAVIRGTPIGAHRAEAGLKCRGANSDCYHCPSVAAAGY